jgi:hypothetical protein
MSNSGALSQSDLLDLWTSVVDPLYAQPLIDEGEGFGLEVHAQAQNQLARVSQAIDITTQSMYIRSWSGETNTSAMGEQYATVTINISRTGLLTSALKLKAGQFVLEEQTTDAGDNEGVTILTGRRYVLNEDVTIAASSTGNVNAQFIAENVGYGYNNPLPGTINTPYQPGSAFQNDKGTIVVDVSPRATFLAVENQPDVVIPEHVGQYVLLTSGSNAGHICRVIGYSPPQPYTLYPTGGTVELEDLTSSLVPELRTSTWRMLDWVHDWHITCSNAAQPVNGRLGMLDALGGERKIYRSPGETDDMYAERISNIGDVVTPNAIVRAANRVLAPYGLKCVLREAGQATLQGFFLDGDPTNPDPAVAYALDMPANNWKVLLDFLEFRAFFAIEIPRLGIGEFGMALDVAPLDAFIGALDGFPAGNAELHKRIWQAVNLVRAGGVSFTIVHPET